MAKCPRCKQRAGKRSCPALGETICTVCCAQSRMLTLACPEDCAYLRDARTATASRLPEQLITHLLERGKDGLIADSRRLYTLVYPLEGAIVEVQRKSFRDLADKEVLEAVENVVKTHETLDRGIIYEHRSESPRVQAVSEAVLQMVGTLKQEFAEKQVRVTTGEWLSVLRLLKELVFMLSNDTDEQSYLRTASLFQPYPQQESKLIVVPG